MSGQATRHVLLVRHPETLANAERRYVGTSESPYTPRGLEQAAMLGDALTRWQPDEVYSSPRARAFDVARLVGGDRVVVLEALKEMDFGRAELMTYDEMTEAGLQIDYPGVRPATGLVLTGETREAFARRIDDVAAALSAGCGRTAVLTHGGVIRGLLGAWLGISPGALYRFDIGNAGHALVGFAAGEPRLRSLGPGVPPPLR